MPGPPAPAGSRPGAKEVLLRDGGWVKVTRILSTPWLKTTQSRDGGR